MEVKHCLDCGDVIRGRTDKKFCDNLCRSSYNNRISGTANNFMRRINRILSHNRRILQNIEKERVRYEELEQMGFRFGHFTNMVEDEGKTYFFCYEFGYVQLENNYFAVVSNKK